MPCKLTENDFELCQALDKCLNWDPDPSQKGLTLVELVNIKTGTLRLAGVSYKKDAKSKSIYLNYCPFCGTPIHQNIQRKETNDQTLQNC